MEWVRLHHESVTGRDGYSDFYKKDITFNVLGPVGDKVEEWTLKGAFIQDANFGDLDFASSDPVEVKETVTKKLDSDSDDSSDESDDSDSEEEEEKVEVKPVKKGKGKKASA